MYHNPGGGAPQGEGQGLRFLNEEWNESISNGESFTLQWNETIDLSDARLGIYRVTYPRDGEPDYELVKNLTGYLAATACQWTPSQLDDHLYAMWLTTVSDGNKSWAISPPWKLKDTSRGRLQWMAPIGIPVLVILLLYALCLGICYWHRRRRRAREAAERARNGSDATSVEDDAAGRHPSVSSVDTEQTLAEPEPEYQKPGSVVLITHDGREFALSERRVCRDPPGTFWLDNIQMDGFRFDRRGSDDDERTLNEQEGAMRMPRRPEDMYVAPGTAI